MCSRSCTQSHLLQGTHIQVQKIQYTWCSCLLTFLAKQAAAGPISHSSQQYPIMETANSFRNSLQGWLKLCWTLKDAYKLCPKFPRDYSLQLHFLLHFGHFSLCVLEVTEKFETKKSKDYLKQAEVKAGFEARWQPSWQWSSIYSAPTEKCQTASGCLRWRNGCRRQMQ